MTFWLAPLLGLLAYAVGVTVARTPARTLLAWERRTGLRLTEWAPCPVEKTGVPRLRAIYCMSGLLIACLGMTAAAALTLIETVG